MADWLQWARGLQALAQNGLTYADNPYDEERYAAVRRIAAEMLAAHTDGQIAAFEARLKREEGYATPKLDVRGACFRKDRILLVRERSDGRWTLPGGWIDVHDSPSAAIEREIREESGFEARTVKLLALWDKARHNHPPDLFHTYKLVFLCEITGGAAAVSVETDGVDFFALDALPPLSEERITAEQIARIFNLYAQPDAPTEYD